MVSQAAKESVLGCGHGSGAVRWDYEPAGWRDEPVCLVCGWRDRPRRLLQFVRDDTEFGGLTGMTLTDRRRIEAAERAAEREAKWGRIVEMRRQGKTGAKIALELRIPKRSVWNVLRRSGMTGRRRAA